MKHIMKRKRMIPDTLAKNLKKLRELNSLTQKDVVTELANMGIDISQQAYNRYENNSSRPDYYTLVMLAKFYKTDMNILTGFHNKEDDNKESTEEKIIKKIDLILHGHCYRLISDNSKNYSISFLPKEFKDDPSFKIEDLARWFGRYYAIKVKWLKTDFDSLIKIYKISDISPIYKIDYAFVRHLFQYAKVETDKTGATYLVTDINYLNYDYTLLEELHPCEFSYFKTYYEGSGEDYAR